MKSLQVNPFLALFLRACRHHFPRSMLRRRLEARSSRRRLSEVSEDPDASEQSERCEVGEGCSRGDRASEQSSQSAGHQLAEWVAASNPKAEPRTGGAASEATAAFSAVFTSPIPAEATRKAGTSTRRPLARENAT
jgi:hypothetical protein